MLNHYKSKLKFWNVANPLIVSFDCISLSDVVLWLHIFFMSLMLQGASFVGNKSPSSLPSPLANPFLKCGFKPLVYQKKLSFHSFRTRRGFIVSEAERQGWDVGRFLKTLYFFNGPPSPAKVQLARFFFDIIGAQVS